MKLADVVVKEEGDNPFVRICEQFSTKKGGCIWRLHIIGKYGRMWKRFLKENHGGIYSYMSLSETLWKHLAEMDEECNEMMDRLVGQMARKEGVTEQLKSDDWLCWFQKMNSIRSRAEEVVLHDLVYSLICFVLFFPVCPVRSTTSYALPDCYFVLDLI